MSAGSTQRLQVDRHGRILLDEGSNSLIFNGWRGSAAAIAIPGLEGRSSHHSALGRKQVPLRAGDAELVRAEVKRSPLHTKSPGGPVWTGDNPPGLLKNFAYVFSLGLLESSCLRRFCFGGRLQAGERRA